MQAILNFRGKQDFNFKNYFILTKLEGFFKYHVHTSSSLTVECCCDKIREEVLDLEFTGETSHFRIFGGKSAVFFTK